jgi:HD superfamily phosphohydrolase YqeK
MTMRITPADLDRIPSGLRPTIPTWAVMTPTRLEHTVRVATLVDGWANRMAVPESERGRWLRAVWLHDAVRDASDRELERLTPGTSGPIHLRHGPASAALAKAHGETDRGVLDAVRFHSLGLAEWEMTGRVLYCADYLEPGRTHDREIRSALAAAFPEDPSGVLGQVAVRRVGHLITSGWVIPEPTWRFWNSLASARSPSSP